MNDPRSPRWKRLLRFAIFTLVALITLAVLIGTWISFQGRREWAKTKAELLARGEKLSFVELVPPPIPDARNFFGDSMWRELTDMVGKPAKEGEPFLKEPRLPRGQRQLDAFDSPVSPALIERAKPLLQGGNQRRLTDPRIKSILLGLSGEMAAATDPSLRRALGEITLDSLRPVQPLLDQIRTTANRPEARLPIEETQGFDPFARTTILGYTLSLAQILQAESRAYLAIDRPDDAAPIVLEGLHLGQAAASDPSLISLTVGIPTISLPATVIAQGISGHQWSGEQLRSFEAALSAIDLRKTAAAALRGERGNANQFYESIHAGSADQDTAAAEFLKEGGKSKYPWQRALARWNLSQAFSPSNQAAFNRFFQNYIDACESPSGLHPDAAAAIPQRAAALGGFGKALMQSAAVGISQALVNLARAQSKIIMARVACALERYWLKNRRYPAALDALVPEFLPKVPSDIVAGQSLRYRLIDPGQFQLWSVGWDGTDENGGPGKTPKAIATGDWVWNRP